jgi:hypothetical protein
MPADRVPVVFIHGLWLHSTSWEPWAEMFRAAGYEPVLPEWPASPPRSPRRAHPEGQAGVGIDQVIDHHAAVVAGLDAPPVLIGHSFGGLVVLALLDRGLGRAGVAIDTGKADRATLLIISGGADRTVPDTVTRTAYKMYGESAAVTEFHQFPGRGHSLTVDSGWHDVAQAALDWLTRRGSAGASRERDPAPVDPRGADGVAGDRGAIELLVGAGHGLQRVGLVAAGGGDAQRQAPQRSRRAVKPATNSRRLLVGRSHAPSGGSASRRTRSSGSTKAPGTSSMSMNSRSSELMA